MRRARKKESKTLPMTTRFSFRSNLHPKSVGLGDVGQVWHVVDQFQALADSVDVEPVHPKSAQFEAKSTSADELDQFRGEFACEGRHWAVQNRRRPDHRRVRLLPGRGSTNFEGNWPVLARVRPIPGGSAKVGAISAAFRCIGPLPGQFRATSSEVGGFGADLGRRADSTFPSQKSFDTRTCVLALPRGRSAGSLPAAPTANPRPRPAPPSPAAVT